MQRQEKTLGKNLISLRKSNKKSILKLLSESGRLYGSDIAKRIGLSVGGTANITDEMLESGLLVKSDAESVVRGRRPYMLNINSDMGVVAVVIVKETAELYISDFGGNLLYSDETVFKDLSGETFEKIIEKLQNYMARSEKRLYAVSVGVGGKIDKDTGDFIYAPSIKDSANVNLKKMFGAAFGIPVKVYNNIVYEMLAEKRYNKEVEIFDTLYVDELGCAIFIGGKLYTGHHGFAGELGLLDIDVYGETLAKYCEGVDKYRSHYFMSPYISAFMQRDSVSLENFAEAYRREDKGVVKRFNGFFDLYARVLRNIVEFMDLGNVVIHGNIANFGDKAIKYIENELVDSRFGRLDVKVYPSVLGTDAAVKGAISVAIEEAFDELIK